MISFCSMVSFLTSSFFIIPKRMKKWRKHQLILPKISAMRSCHDWVFMRNDDSSFLYSFITIDTNEPNADVMKVSGPMILHLMRWEIISSCLLTSFRISMIVFLACSINSFKNHPFKPVICSTNSFACSQILLRSMIIIRSTISIFCCCHNYYFLLLFSK